MILIKINPAKIDPVLFLSDTEAEEKLLDAIWPLIEPMVVKIKRKLRKNAKRSLVKLGKHSLSPGNDDGARS